MIRTVTAIAKYDEKELLLPGYNFISVPNMPGETYLLQNKVLLK
jgi:hypothetical protein